MDTLIWLGLVGFLGATLLLSAFLDAQRSSESVARAHKMFEHGALSPISELEKFLSGDNETDRS